MSHCISKFQVHFQNEVGPAQEWNICEIAATVGEGIKLDLYNGFWVKSHSITDCIVQIYTTSESKLQHQKGTAVLHTQSLSSPVLTFQLPQNRFI
jgi:hypothetical protein